MYFTNFYLLFIFGLWSLSSVKSQSPCPSIKLANGRVKLRSSGRLVEYKCKQDFELVGIKYAVCKTSGQWSQQIPTCVGTTCPKPNIDSSMIVEELYNGGMLKYSCTTGLTRSGPETIMCDGKKWDDDPPKCIESKSMDCDFEDSDLCGWSQDITDDFDWIRNSGETTTANTGPMFDHTKNNSDGHYLFMESSAPQKSGQKTRIISPAYAPEKVKNMCLEFYYHMLGPDGNEEVGDLDVYIKPVSLNMSRINTAKTIFHIGGNQGDQWNRAETDILTADQAFNFVFQATRLNSWTGDIAIDDVKLIKCSERTTSIPTSKKPTTNNPTTNNATTNNPTRNFPTRKRIPTPPTSATSTITSTTTQSISASTTKRKPKQATTTTHKPSSLSTAIKINTLLTTKSSIVVYATTAKKVLKTTPIKIIPTTPSFENKLLTSTTSSKTSGEVEINTRAKATLPSSTQDKKITASNIENKNNDGEDNDNTNNEEGTDDEHEDNDKINSSSDYIDLTNNDSNYGQNQSASTNDSQAPFVDYETDTDGANSRSEDDSLLDGLLADAGSVKDDHTSSRSVALLPLIIGIVASVVVGVSVVAILAWLWVRGLRQKENRHDDHLNIITEYAETKLT